MRTLIDDLQWADVASISLLFHVGRQLEGHRLLIVCAYRPEEVALAGTGQRHPLAKLLTEFKRSFGNTRLHLGSRERAVERRFVDAILDSKPNRYGEAFRDKLTERTQGHPLFTLALLYAMASRSALREERDGVWQADPQLDWNLLPAQIEAVIEERIDRLEPGLREILTIASVEGDIFTAQLVAALQESSERTVMRRLTVELERQHRLVREEDEFHTGRRRLARYRFSHVLYQDYLYRQINQVERQLLHQEVARILESLYAGQLDDLAAKLAHHFRLAGEHAGALRYFTRAAERATRMFAHAEAFEHFTRAIEAAEIIKADADMLTRLYRGRGLAAQDRRIRPGALGLSFRRGVGR